MKMTIAWATILVLALYSGVFAQGIGTAFTYQGRLNDDGSAASGKYDFEFTLYDDEIAGSQVDTTKTKEDVNVYDGYFTVDLDFGGDAFADDGRWLAIGVRPFNSTAAFTDLAPRQEITPTPYAMQTRGFWTNNTNTFAGIDTGANGLRNTFLGASTGFSNLTGNSNTFVGYFAGNQNTGGHNNVMIGRNTGSGNTTGGQNTFLGTHSGYNNTSGESNLFAGYKAGYNNQTGNNNVFLGYKAGYSQTGDNKLYIANGENDSNVLIYGDFATGRLGLGTINPEYKLDVRGNRIQLKDDASGDWLAMRVDGGALDLQFEGGNLYVQGVNDGEHILLNPNRDSNVGIGTTTPSDKLDVDGHINSTQSYKLNGATVLANPGAGNIFVGEEAGAGNTTGYRNAAVGRSALRVNTEGTFNSAMGGQALFKNTTGSHNSAMGQGALYENTTGWDNSAMGHYALTSNTEGRYNSATGASALYGNTLGFYNVGVGFEANKFNQEGSANTIIGYQAGAGINFHNKHGNVFIGYQAGKKEQGNDKLYISNSDTRTPLIYGDFADDILTVNGALGIGTTEPNEKLSVAGHIDSSESYKLDGVTVLANPGSENIFVGPGAGINTNTGHNNSAMGQDALHTNTTGAQNSAMGSKTLFNNTTGHSNSAMGYYALYYNTTGDYNLATGYYALLHNTIGRFNVGIGGRANLYNQEGSYNTIIGYQAGQGVSDHDKSGNVFLGYQAGYYETGDDKLYIDNSDTLVPLIHGDFATDRLGVNRKSMANTLEVGGNASKTTAGSWLANSDARIKTDIQTVTHALDTIGKVRLVNFKYTDDYRNQHPGIEDRPYLNVLAQEFAHVFPDYVQASGEKLSNGQEILQVDTYPLTIYTAAAVQELKTENEMLKQEINELKKNMTILMNSQDGGQK
ncbi:MAG: tail fiber domain-containing protein [Planctomycetes bacterium]|nr:tail fiber domain-containing protein [Planctomycetota bacterium]